MLQLSPLRSALRAFLVMGVFAFPATAVASTAVTGVTGDSQTPIRIAPDDDPVTTNIPFGTPDVAFIQTMPRTLTIDGIKLGDLGRGTSCPSGATVTGYIRQFDENDLAGDSRQIAYSNEVPLPVDLGPVTLKFAPTTLLEGSAYSLRISRSCAGGQMRTWAHNSATVNGGTKRCAAVPGLGSNRRRMWHVYGQDDRDPTCVNSYYAASPYNGFHPSMPTGWLATATYNSDDWYVRFSTRPRNPECAGDTTMLDLGAKDLFWRPSASENEGDTDWVCSWPMFSPAGTTVPDGWYYAGSSIPERAGKPRDVALELQPAPEPPRAVPDCAGVTYQQCTQLLDAAGFADHDRTVATGAGVDFSKGAGVTISTSPQAGQVVPKATHVDVYTNPDEPEFGSALVDRYRPELLFDNSELFRPVDLDSLFAETDDNGNPVHRLCQPSLSATCEPLVTTAQLTAAAGSDAYIDIAGHGTGSDYFSPYLDCDRNGTNDCDAGPRSALYYHVADVGSYRFLDYWAYYRFNDSTEIAETAAPLFGEDGFKHESDWESVTVGVPRDHPSTFDFASFSQHGSYYSYLRQNLSCDGGGSGSCGDDAVHQGARISSYVAHNSHANYPQSCRRLAPSLIGLVSECPQDRPDKYVPEAGGHDGSKPWGNNDAQPSVSLREFPHEADSWVHWPGRWGHADTSVDGPASPGNQPHFGAPWESTCGRNNTDCPIYQEEGAPPARQATAPASSSRDTVNCPAWFGVPTTVLVCDQDRLASAIDAGTVGRASTLNVTTSKQAVRLPSGRGLAQSVAAPLAIGDTMTIVPSGDASLRIMARVITAAGTVATLDVPGIAARAGQSLRLRITQVGTKLGLMRIPS